MELGMIGLGKMGANMTGRLLRAGHRVVVDDIRPEAMRAAAAGGAVAADSPEALVRVLAPPRVVWLMVPAGGPVDMAIEALLPHLSPGDILVDGGNSNYKDSIARAKMLAEREIHFLDVGVSGGIWGLKVGYCLMVGGPEEAYRRLEPLFASL